MDAARLYRQFFEWDKAKSPDWKDEKDGNVFPGGKVVRIGPESITIIPAENPGHIVKIIKPGSKPRGLSVEEEYEMAKALQATHGENFITPVPVSFGHDPDYFEMVRLEGIAPRRDETNADEICQIGTAVGEFQAALVEKHGAIHKDIGNSNLLICDGKIAVLDMASIVPVSQAGFVEMMFIPTLAVTPNYSPHIAEEYEKRTGKPINFDILRALVLWAPAMFQNDAEDSEKAIKNLNSNFAAWEEMRSSAQNCHRPGSGCKAKGFDA
ncbi:MAG: hypothetical protein PHW76_07320 [Alphaproteobacteria bacterium]|nr:hypothetical protein [Alphaproteobacteria bacterium]